MGGDRVGHIERHLLLGLLDGAEAVDRDHRAVLANPVSHVYPEDVAAWTAGSGVLENLKGIEGIGAELEGGEGEPAEAKTCREGETVSH